MATKKGFNNLGEKLFGSFKDFIQPLVCERVLGIDPITEEPLVEILNLEGIRTTLETSNNSIRGANNSKGFYEVGDFAIYVLNKNIPNPPTTNTTTATFEGKNIIIKGVDLDTSETVYVLNVRWV